MEHCYIFIFKNSCIKGTSQFKPMLFEGQLYFYMFQYVVFNAFVMKYKITQKNTQSKIGHLNDLS